MKTLKKEQLKKAKGGPSGEHEPNPPGYPDYP